MEIPHGLDIAMITYTASGQNKSASSTSGQAAALIALAKKCKIRDAYGALLRSNVAVFYSRDMQLVGIMIVKITTTY